MTGHREIILDNIPSMKRILVSGLMLSLVRPGRPGPETEFSTARLVVKNREVSPAIVDRYKAVCGYPASRTDLPPAFIQSLFVPLLGRYITSGLFPLNPMGLIHIFQRIIQYRRIDAGIRLDLYCGLTGTRKAARGLELDFELTARHGGMDIWRGQSVFLIRTGRDTAGRGRTDGADPLPVRHVFQVKKECGRTYAAVSGDYNPHHLSGLFARMLGFRTAIAHGMWTLGRTLAALEQDIAWACPVTADIYFKRPVYLPSTITLGYETERRTTGEGGGAYRLQIEVRNAESGVPHLLGALSYPVPV